MFSLFILALASAPGAWASRATFPSERTEFITDPPYLQSMAFEESPGTEAARTPPSSPTTRTSADSDAEAWLEHYLTSENLNRSGDFYDKAVRGSSLDPSALMRTLVRAADREHSSRLKMTLNLLEATARWARSTGQLQAADAEATIALTRRLLQGPGGQEFVNYSSCILGAVGGTDASQILVHSLEDYANAGFPVQSQNGSASLGEAVFLMMGLGETRSGLAVPVLVRVAEKGSPALATDALEALAKIGRPEGLEAFAYLFEKSDDYALPRLQAAENFLGAVKRDGYVLKDAEADRLSKAITDRYATWTAPAVKAQEGRCLALIRSLKGADSRSQAFPSPAPQI